MRSREEVDSAEPLRSCGVGAAVGNNSGLSRSRRPRRARRGPGRRAWSDLIPELYYSVWGKVSEEDEQPSTRTGGGGA